MARITVEDCLGNINNIFEMVLVAAKRARRVAHGAEPMVDLENDKPTVVALREIAEGHKPFGLTFGTGLHACLGQDLAAGLVPGSSREHGEGHLLGTVPRLAWTLLRHGARPDPDDPATRDAATSRGNWGRYPVRFESELAAH